MRALFTLTLFLGSFLLFLVEPMVAKMILPTFGGSPQVWNTCLFFFQGALLLGYLYAHVAAKRIGTKRHAIVHLVLMLLAVALLPFSTHSAIFTKLQASIGQSGTSLWVLVALTVLVGLPFFVVSAGAPMLQRWFAQTNDKAAKDPYFLYSASNIGSMIGLFAYPFVLEPTQTLGEQAHFWQVGFLVLVVLVAACAIVLLRLPEQHEAEQQTAPQPIASGVRWRWIALAAVPSSLLMGVTTYLTSNIAPIPLLWVIPLALYLLTFILAFARFGSVPLVALQRLLPLIATPLALAIILESAEPIVPLAIFHLAVFFVAAWVCHGQLAESRPDPAHLTEFYFYLALGGVVGGSVNALIAPVLFNGLYEYPLALAAACMLRNTVVVSSASNRKWDLAYPVLVAVVAIIAAVGAKMLNLPLTQVRSAAVIGVPLVFCFFAVDRPKRYGLALVAVFAVSFALHTSSGASVRLSRRSFYGVHRVLVTDKNRHELTHGNTVHGMQDMLHPQTPLTYYYPSGPIGLVMNRFGSRLKNVALVGLGVGSIAAYGRPGQTFTYYEIDPTVLSIARDSGYFTFLKDSKADMRYVIGDARLTLARSKGGFDCIVLDAFSSDAIPVHLLTKEAIEMYKTKLAPGGFLVFHISNKYLDITDVLASTGNAAHMGAMIDEDGSLPDETAAGKYMSRWMILANSENDLIPLQKALDWSNYDVVDAQRPWTDDYSNVLSSVRLDQ